MRITGGTLRGRVLASKVAAGVRPTSSRVREALFSMVGQNLEGVSVLDGFGGSGLLTFEAVSRGAVVTTVERNRGVARVLQANADNLKVRLDLRIADVRSVLGAGTWKIVLLDPPYADDPVEWGAQASSAAEDMLVIEHKSGPEMPQRIGGLELERSRRYGDSVLSIYRRRSLPGLNEVDVVP